MAAATKSSRVTCHAVFDTSNNALQDAHMGAYQWKGPFGFPERTPEGASFANHGPSWMRFERAGEPDCHAFTRVRCYSTVKLLFTVLDGS